MQTACMVHATRGIQHARTRLLDKENDVIIPSLLYHWPFPAGYSKLKLLQTTDHMM